MSVGFKYFLTRLVIFLVGFVMVSGIIGPWVIPTRLLYGYGFYIYGNLGKLVVYSAILFILFVRDRLPVAEKPSKNSFGWLYLAGSAVLTGIFFPVASKLLASPTQGLLIATHVILIAIPALLFLFAFPVKNIARYLADYKRELALCVGISVAFDLAIFQVWKLWPLFSGIVLVAVKWLFSLTYSDVVAPGGLTLYVHGVGVQILQACSGVDSLFLFTALYLIIGILDWKKFNHTKYILAFIPAVIGLFIVNILRVYLIVLAGVLISPEVMAKLFHTYAGMILFIVYFGVFWALMYKRLIRPRQK